MDLDQAKAEAKKASLFLHRGLVELRPEIGPNTYFSGFYDDRDKLAFDAAETEAKSVYWTLNEIAGRDVTNELQSAARGECTGKGHIVRIRNLFVDIDPQRPKGTASTEAAHQASIDLANTIHADRRAEGWPDGLIQDSGNGCYVIWGIDLPPDQQPLIKAVIDALRKRYATPALNIDRKTVDLSRVARVPGTENRKGDPSRFARILQMPEQRVEVTQAQLEAFVWANLPSSAPAEPIIDYQATIDREKAWLDSRNVAFDVEDHGEYTILRIHPCPWRPDQDDGNAWLRIHPEQGVSAGCFHSKCAGKNLKALRQKLGGIDQVTAPSGLQTDIDDPHYLAQRHIDHFAVGGQRTSVVMAGEMLLWQDGVWQPAISRDVSDHVTATIKREFDAAAQRSGQAPRKVKSNLVKDTIGALRSLSLMPPQPAPFWIGDAPFGWDANDMMAFGNCLLNLPSWLVGASIDRIKPTPLYFDTHKLAFDYMPDAPEPKRWLQFLRELWDDQESADLLHEWGGYVCSSDMSRQKMMMLIGEPRGGKGTICWVLSQMVGGKIAAPKLQTLSTRFGLQPLLGKRVAICSDARNLKGVSLDGVCEVLKAITGQDAVEVDVKKESAVTAQLPIKFIIQSNYKLAIPDTSSALQARQLFLRFDKSFVGREDERLKDKLRPELPAIANLFLAGLRRLTERGKFTEPAASRELAKQIRHIGNPILGYVESRCTIDDKLATPATALYDDWQRWAEDMDAEPMSRNAFGEQLLATFRNLSKTQNVGGRKVTGKRPMCFVGIGLKST